VPELPEVETMRRGILAIVGAAIRDVRSAGGRLKPIGLEPKLPAFRRRCMGQTIQDVRRVGKRVVLELGSSQVIVFEPRMTGLVLLSDPPDPEHLRMRIALKGSRHGELLYWDRRGLGSVRLLRPDEFDVRCGPEQLGPDALTVSADELQSRLGHSRRAIKVALLEQKAIAGIGNLYASEILHAARLDPLRPACALARRDWVRLQGAVRDVLLAAIQYEGSTLADGTYRNALNQPGAYQHQHRVYGRAGEPCRTCGRARVVRVVLAQRSTFFCPRCQLRL